MQRAPYPQISPPDDPDYPSDDGLPMSDNTRQFDWIVAVQGGLDARFYDDPEVMVTGNCLWYPVEGDNKIRTAPDVMVIFGRPKGHRGSYIQHREGGVPVQVTFEVLSRGNRPGEMRRKLAFYERHGVEEYYVLDPDRAQHRGYTREGGKLAPIADLFGWTSPRLGVRFEMTEQLRIIGPDGRPFEMFAAVVKQRDRSDRRADEATRLADEERDRADEATRLADQARDRADEATRSADEATRRAERERLRVERLLAQLRALGMEPEA